MVILFVVEVLVVLAEVTVVGMLAEVKVVGLLTEVTVVGKLTEVELQPSLQYVVGQYPTWQLILHHQSITEFPLKAPIAVHLTCTDFSVVEDDVDEEVVNVDNTEEEEIVDDCIVVDDSNCGEVVETLNVVVEVVATGDVVEVDAILPLLFIATSAHA